MTPSFDEVNASVFDDATDLDWTLNFTFLGDVNTTAHQLDIYFFEDGVEIDTDLAVAVDASQAYLYTSTGLGGASGGKKYHALYKVVKKTGGNIVDDRSTTPKAAFT